MPQLSGDMWWLVARYVQPSDALAFSLASSSILRQAWRRAHDPSDPVAAGRAARRFPKMKTNLKDFFDASVPLSVAWIKWAHACLAAESRAYVGARHLMRLAAFHG